jgi:UDP-glucose 4-epimerase
MNILVLGAGLVGCYFAREAMERGHQVVLYDVAPNDGYIGSVAPGVSAVRGDVRDLPAIVETIQGHRADAVFLNAGIIGGKAEERPFTTLSVNVGGAIATAEAARLSGVRRLVFASTFGVYNWDLPPTAPVTEDFPVAGNVFYSGSKVACERILRAYGNKYGIQVAILRFAVVYGRGHYAGGAAAGQVLHEAIEAAQAGRPVRLDTRVSGLTEYVYVKDVVQGVLLACEKPLQNAVFNIGTGVLTGRQEVANAIHGVFPSVEIQVDTVRPEQRVVPRDQPLDLSRSSRELGYRPQFDLLKGVADFAREIPGPR